jgi:hypothetical protein
MSTWRERERVFVCVDVCGVCVFVCLCVCVCVGERERLREREKERERERERRPEFFSKTNITWWGLDPAVIFLNPVFKIAAGSLPLCPTHFSHILYQFFTTTFYAPT